MKGELPISYIVGIILAVAIIAVISYIFFTQSSSWQEVALQKYCEARAYEWCNKDPKPPWPFDVKCSPPQFPEPTCS